MEPEALAAVARSVFLCWLLLPGLGIPLSLLAQKLGHSGFLPRLVPWFVVVLAVLIPSYAGAWYFLALVCAVAVMGAWELAGLSGGGARIDRRAMTAALSTIALAMPLWAQFGDRVSGPLTLVVMVAGGVVWLAAGRGDARWPVIALAASLGAALAFWIRLERPSDGFRFVAWAFSVVAVNDIFGFVAGRLMPKGRPWPRLSPGKTWSGYAGGIAAAVLIGQLGAFCLPEFSRADLVWLAVLLAASGSAGDLAGSAIKRRYHVKDFSGALGPMGGVLDRIDSLLGAGWIFYLVLRWSQVSAG